MKHAGLSCLLLAGLTCHGAAAMERSLVIAFSRETDYVDRLHTDSSESAALSLALYDTLLYRDPASGRMRGLLAETWEWNSERTAVEFQLRRNVVFHDGEAFDADDVLYTIGLVTDPRSNFRQQDASFGFIKRAEKTGPHAVRVQLKYPTALAEDVFASRLLIWPDRYTRMHGGHIAHRTGPVGTGPYRAARVSPGREVLLLANRSYFAGPKPRPAVAALRVRFVPDAQTQIAELLDGSLDFIWDLPADQARFLAADPRFRVSYATGARITFMSLDAAGRSGVSPLQDRRVREAIVRAIDREAIALHLAGPSSVPIRFQCHPLQRNCPPAGERDPSAFDPHAARELLAQAGYAEGLALELQVGSSRLRPLAEAIQWQLLQVGIELTVRQFTLPAWRRKFMAGASRASLVSFGGDLLDVALTLPGFFDGGASDYARDPEVARRVDAALRTPDAAQQAAGFRQALRRIADQAYTVPLHTVVANFVYRRDLCYEPGNLPLPDLLRLAPCRAGLR